MLPDLRPWVAPDRNVQGAHTKARPEGSLHALVLFCVLAGAAIGTSFPAEALVRFGHGVFNAVE